MTRSKKTDTMSADAYQELLRRQTEEEQRPGRRRSIQWESMLQQQCVRAFRLKYPKHARMLFSVPNGAARSSSNASRVKAEGMVDGVSDLILLEARGRYGALCIEMKRDDPHSKQSKAQREWQGDAEFFGNRYVVARSVDEFMRKVDEYMELSPLTFFLR